MHLLNLWMDGKPIRWMMGGRIDRVCCWVGANLGVPLSSSGVDRHCQVRLVPWFWDEWKVDDCDKDSRERVRREK